MQGLVRNVKNAFKLNFLIFHAIIPLQVKTYYLFKKKEDIILCGLQINGKIMK